MDILNLYKLQLILVGKLLGKNLLMGVYNYYGYFPSESEWKTPGFSLIHDKQACNLSTGILTGHLEKWNKLFSETKTCGIEQSHNGGFPN